MPKDPKEFKGPQVLMELFQKTLEDLDKTYYQGTTFCLAGPHGCGKTMTCTNILKRASQKGYSTLYATLSDIVSALTTGDGTDRATARKELLESDFLTIDEFDPRFVSSENSSDLFGRTLENIIRTRLQNKLPVFLISNSPNPLETFTGALKQSLQSLMHGIQFIPVIGKDVRKEIGIS